MVREIKFINDIKRNYRNYTIKMVKIIENECDKYHRNDEKTLKIFSIKFNL